MSLSARAARAKRETRTFQFELRRSDTPDGRTLDGLAAPFDSPTEIRDAFGTFTEVIRPDSFTRTIAERGDRVKLLANHDRDQFPLGNIGRLWETGAGLMMSARVSNTTAGNDALELVADDVVRGLSIGFQVVDQTWNADYSSRELTEVKLLEISLVTEPAYADAGVTAVRTRLDDLYDQLDALEGRAPTAAPLSVSLALRELDFLQETR
jgi:HK97 family phage prohead protease